MAAVRKPVGSYGTDCAIDEIDQHEVAEVPKQPRKVASHPKYENMILTAVQAMKERQGSSRQAIFKYIMANFDIGQEEKPVNTYMKVALMKAVGEGKLKQAKGIGANGRFRVGDKKVAEKEPNSVVKKPAAATNKTKPAVKEKTKVTKKAASTPKKAVKPKQPAPKTKKASKSPAKPKRAVKGPAKSKVAAKVEKKAPKPAKATKPKTPKKAAPKKATKA